MIPQQHQQQQGQAQRPIPNGQGLQALIFQTLAQQAAQPGAPQGGWQANVMINERMGLVFNMSVTPRSRCLKIYLLVQLTYKVLVSATCVLQASINRPLPH